MKYCHFFCTNRLEWNKTWKKQQETNLSLGMIHGNSSKLIPCIIIILSYLICDWLLIREVHMFYRTQGLLVPAEWIQWGCVGWGSNSQPLGLKTKCLAFELNSSKLEPGRSRVYRDGVLHHYYFIISHLWLTSHPRSTYVLQDTRTVGTCRVDSVRMRRVRLELATYI